jgi:lysophospholipase L1-like esterase
MTGFGGSSFDGGIDGPSATGGRGGTGGRVSSGGTAGGAGTGGAGGRDGGAAGTSGSGGAAGAGGGTVAVVPCPATGDCKVMPVGDSITWKGYCDGAYRADLFKLALTNAKHMTFVGRQKDGPDSVTVNGTTTPFPKNHEGYSGYTIDSGGGRTGISTLIDAALTANPPHIVLLMIGTNDVDINYNLSTAPDRLGALMDKITSGAPNALLVVAQIVPTQSSSINTRVETYNKAIPGLVQSRVAAGKHIIVVDMYGAFVANPNYATALMTDRLHPNEAGCLVMATTWYDGIKSYLP